MNQPSRPDHSEGPVLRWADAMGSEWVLTPNPQQLRLNGPEEQVTLARKDWDSCIDYNKIGGRVVFRFDVGTKQVGFMVAEDQARLLLDHMEWTNERAQASAARLRDQAQRPHTWPTATPWSVGALFAAALAFLPIVGLAFALLAIVCMTISISRARANPRLMHNNTLVTAGTAILILAVSANLLSLWLWVRDLAPAVIGHASELDQITLPNKIIAVIVVLLSLSVHEASHAVMAWWCGDEGPLQRGRVTLNPLAHIDPVGTILVPAFLAYAGAPVFGWARPVKVSLHQVPNPRRANLMISAAGPFSNLLLGLIFLSLYLILGCCIRLFAPSATVANFCEPIANVHMSGFAVASYLAMVTVCLKWGFLINLLLCFFNLIPLPPLDGGHIAISLFPNTVGEFYRKLGPLTLLIFLGLIATGLIERILLPGMIIINSGFVLVRSVTGL